MKAMPRHPIMDVGAEVPVDAADVARGVGADVAEAPGQVPQASAPHIQWAVLVDGRVHPFLALVLTASVGAA